MVPFTDSLLRACRKLAIKLEASMRFQGRVYLSEIGTPEHDYNHLIQLFGEHFLMLHMLAHTRLLTALCIDNHVVP